MVATSLCVAILLASAEPAKDVTDTEKAEFLRELAKLPTKGEFLTDEAVKKAVPWTRVLLALTEKDLEKRDIYPFLALSSGLMGEKEARQYAVINFNKIAHPTIKLAWAMGLFDEKEPPAEVVSFLRKMVESEKEARALSGMLGPGFQEFKSQVISADEAKKETKVELVKKHQINAFPEYGGGFDYTNESCVFAPGQRLYAVCPFDQKGELWAYNVGDQEVSRLVIPQPKEFTPEFDFSKYFENSVLSINSSGDLFCRWAIKGNGDHGLALLKKGSTTFLVKRVKLYLADCCVVAAPEGDWYLVQWSAAADFTVYHVDKELNLTRLGNFAGMGFHSVRILDARFISKDLLHLFWGDVIVRGNNHLRMRCVDFDVKERKWLHSREIFRLDKFVSSANEPTVLQLKDDSLHHVWRIDDRADKGEATGLYYQAESDGKTVKVTSAYQYRAVAAGDRIVICYTVEGSPDSVYFRVIKNGIAGPVREIKASEGRKHNLWSEYMVLYAEADRVWFVNTIAKDALFEFKLVDARKP
jgi:hypothetical protein